MAETQVEVGDQVSWKWGSGNPSGEVVEVKEHGELAIQSNKGNTIKKNADPEDPAVHITREGNDVVKRAHELQTEEKAGGANGEQANGEATEGKERPAEEVEKTEENKEVGKKDEQMTDAPKEAADDKQEEPVKEKGATDSTEATNAEVAKEGASEGKGEASEEPAVPQTGDKRNAEDALADMNGAEKDQNEMEPATKKQKTEDVDATEKPKGKPGRPKKAETEKKEKKEPAKKREPKKAATADGAPRRSARKKA
ncbi:hypothetical protein GQ43DRAFT_439756 [Delitschia confertaspora ATCC 74209]|uniref:Hypervirulence associated protein TUDOR domain-containing protein n=1 Tax=Delitschia confertaspora ATCC 74209 TaxID=1513339 RepID=A0A9P4MTB5_9PLEO|nr:hypothetical protein GQ43DRAFT_439756 [Delitschia confertaspora ATCC 74209]